MYFKCKVPVTYVFQKAAILSGFPYVVILPTNIVQQTWHSRSIFDSFGLSTKESYTVMLCPSSLASASLLSLVSASVHTSPCNRVRYRNFTFGIGGSRGGGCRMHAHPTGSNSFIFAYIFAKKCPCRGSMPPQWVHASPWEILDLPLFGIHMHRCPPNMHIKYLVIMTCSV